jgi:hypothetical protein
VNDPDAGRRPPDTEARRDERAPFGGVSRKDALGVLVATGVVFLIAWLLHAFGGY